MYSILTNNTLGKGSNTTHEEKVTNDRWYLENEAVKTKCFRRSIELTFSSLEVNCKGRVAEAVVVSNLLLLLKKSWFHDLCDQFFVLWESKTKSKSIGKILFFSCLISLKSNDPWGIPICTFAKWVLPFRELESNWRVLHYWKSSTDWTKTFF